VSPVFAIPPILVYLNLKIEINVDVNVSAFLLFYSYFLLRNVFYRSRESKVVSCKK